MTSYGLSMPGRGRSSWVLTEDTHWPWSSELEDARCAALGNSFHTNTVACLLDLAFAQMGLKEAIGSEEIVATAISKTTRPPEPDAPSQSGLSDSEREEREVTDDEKTVVGEHLMQELEENTTRFLTDEEILERSKQLSSRLVAAFIRRQEFRGSDVRLDLGSLYRPDSFPRGSIDPSRWLWHAAASYAFERSEHINVLELRALIHSFEWRLRSSKFSRCRALHLTDSIVALSVCVKGRSSARVLNRLLRRDMPKRVLEGHQTKESRAQARKALGKLKHQVLSAKSEDRYRECFTAFRNFQRLPESFTLPDFEEFDEMVAEFIEMLWETGEPKTQANYTLAAIQHFRPQAKHHLPWSWKLVKVWNQVEMPNRATPMSPEIAIAFAGLAFKWKQPIFGWLVLVGYALFLRTGELLALGPSDVTLAQSRAVVFVRSSKGTKRSFLPLERLEVTESTALQALRALLRLRRGQSTFWPESRRSFLETWHSLVAGLKLPPGFYKPYSLRRGGATSCYKNGATLDELVTKGRWQHLHTARVYLDTGLQALATLQLPTASPHASKQPHVIL
eukprot:s233_g39.t1